MKKTVKRRRLKRWVRVTLKVIAFLVAALLLALLFIKANNDLNDMYEACDNAKGYTCSYYEARLYSIKGE